MTTKALWTPAWYELDQTLLIGVRQKFWFFRDRPEIQNTNYSSFDLIFFNSDNLTDNCSVRYAKVDAIRHFQLGPILKVDTAGLDYIFFPASGDEIIVNAEESPGAVDVDGEFEVSDWSLEVTLSDLSDVDAMV
ncbi:MAG: hypothetical protein AAF623_05650 [Planctomycetota bacterium]